MIRRRRLALFVLIALVVAACGDTGPVGEATTSSASSAAGSAVASSATPGDSAEPAEPTDETPSATEAPPASDNPDEPTDEPTDEPGASTAPDAAGACTGTDANREFFAGVAAAVDWTVLCPVLPKGWFVKSGTYRFANGGRLLISYKGPGGDTLALSEGGFCKDADGCVPEGTDAGEAALGSMSGTLVSLDDGGWAIVVDRGASVSWVLETQGLDQATTTSFGAALSEVEG